MKIGNSSSTRVLDEPLKPTGSTSLFSEALRLQGGASRARSGGQTANKGSLICIVPLDLAYPALAGRGTFRPMDLLPSSDETLDLFLDGKLQVIQKKKGYRFSVDALLLAQFIAIRKNERVIDLGTGCGILPLLLSQDPKAHSFVGVEIQEDLVECAEKNVALNHLEDRISFLKQDFRELRTVFPPGTFDVVLSNPPYREHHTGRINPSMDKAIARHEIKGKLGDLISVASYLLPAKGRCYLIFPALRAVDLFVELRKGKLEPKRIQFVHPRTGEEAKFILVESLKGSGVELKILKPLILEDSSPSAGK